MTGAPLSQGLDLALTNAFIFQIINSLIESWGVRLTCLDRKNALDLQISSLVGYFKKANAFLVYTICFNDSVHDKWCLDKSVEQTESDLERGFVKHWLNSV